MNPKLKYKLLEDKGDERNNKVRGVMYCQNINIWEKVKVMKSW